MDIINIKVDLIQCGRTSCAPDWQVTENGVVFHRIYYIYGGRAIFESDKERYPLEKDCLYLFPINKPYRIAHDPKNPLECLWFHAVTFPAILNDTIKLHVQDFPVILYLTKAMACLVNENDVNETLLKPLLESLLLCINRKTALFVMNDQRLGRILDYINQHYMDELTNEYLASLVNLDRHYFIRLFKKVFGITPQKYLSNYRLSRAVDMLMDGIPIEKIAEQVGFQDAKAFSRFFKNNKGIPPSDYRKSHYGQP